MVDWDLSGNMGKCSKLGTEHSRFDEEWNFTRGKPAAQLQPSLFGLGGPACAAMHAVLPASPGTPSVFERLAVPNACFWQCQLCGAQGQFLLLAVSTADNLHAAFLFSVAQRLAFPCMKFACAWRAPWSSLRPIL
jgi:hypothetical protein